LAGAVAVAPPVPPSVQYDRRVHRPPLAAAISLALIAASLAGCGGGDEPATPAETVVRTEAATITVAETVTVAAPAATTAAPEPTTLAATGPASTAAETVEAPLPSASPPDSEAAVKAEDRLAEALRRTYVETFEQYGFPLHEQDQTTHYQVWGPEEGVQLGALVAFVEPGDEDAAEAFFLGRAGSSDGAGWQPDLNGGTGLVRRYEHGRVYVLAVDQNAADIVDAILVGYE